MEALLKKLFAEFVARGVSAICRIPAACNPFPDSSTPLYARILGLCNIGYPVPSDKLSTKNVT